MEHSGDDPGNAERSDKDSVQYVASAWMHAQHRVLAYLSASVGDFHEAEDLLQEVAAIVLSSHDKVDRSRSFTAWCIGIAKNLVRNHFRKKARFAFTCDDAFLDALADAAVRVDEQLNDRQRALKECIEKLPKRKAEVLRLRYEDDLEPAEIGRLMGLSRSNVVVMLHRIRRSLADCVSAHLQRSAR